MGDFKDYLKEENKDCLSVNTIKDVNDLWSYTDPGNTGNNDRKWVSCGQDEETSGYSELKDKFERYYEKNGYSENEIAKAMCECCKELKGNIPQTKITWDAFYNCMKEKGFDK
jgi:hypothetical protein